ncbi:lebercilin-like protein isoform X1 [Girardinichthys multiradiatus]|uniref:lebercilin-like protein isoform X1 n=1 Tax=Girardinichthys multiradiatus TaxID=208333 RepID=UPI001FADD368|nr:lebercilin-like protein isoform X1 [Girardinichthys multiradiatus]XP_047247293.1 lebercilin-like protein isoform X1 [Girardinichthys multiradiatus]XP_047247295.1 lebercilin-like protein isoform X1 [Girardinichthys multiradiatus]
MDKGDCDIASCSTNTSRWSSPCCDSDGPEHPSNCEERADRTPGDQQSPTLQGSKQSEYSTKGAQKQKMKHEIQKLPPISPLQGSKPRNQSANMNCIWMLKSQVWDLQQQLSEARTENKLLKKVQHRHMVVQQNFRDPEDSISQILAKHKNETKALQGMLREIRMCRDNLARQLQATERKLLSTKYALQHLQQLNLDHSLLEREELTLRLAKATSQLDDKDRRIQNMERTLELHQESFKRQMDTEQRKIREARKASSCLQEYVHQLTRELQLREKQVQKHNIYYHWIVKGPSKKGRENKMVQTDGLVLLPHGFLNGDVLAQIEGLVNQEESVN